MTLRSEALLEARNEQRPVRLHYPGDVEHGDVAKTSGKQTAEQRRSQPVQRIVDLGGIVPKEKLSRHMEGRAVAGDALQQGSRRRSLSRPCRHT